MLDPALVLAAASRTPAGVDAGRPTRRVLVIGGAGALGTSVVERLVGAGRFHPVAVVVTRPMTSRVRGLQLVDDADAAWRAVEPDTALIVFDRERRVHGREDALLRPGPRDLPVLARRLAGIGVRRLLVVMPQGPQGLPEALRHGLAHLDEGSVSALGFEQLVFCRLATGPGAGPGATTAGGATGRLQRLAELMLSQLQWMVPATQAPVRPKTVAEVVAAVLAGWASAAPATRILPPELPWQVAQGGDAEALVQVWLGGGPLPPWRAPRRRW